MGHSNNGGGQAMVVRGHDDVEIIPAPFEPNNLDQAYSLAERLATASLLPVYLRGKPSDVFMTLLLGRDLGLTAMQAITGIHVIEGKPSVSAQTAVALVKRSGLCKYFRLVEGSDKAASYETHRVGEPGPTRMTYTIEEAQRAGLSGKHNWKAYPAAMLRARCAMALARDVYPDLIANVYDPEELEDRIEQLRTNELTPPPTKTAPTPLGKAPAPASKAAHPPAPPAPRGPDPIPREIAEQSKRDLAQQRRAAADAWQDDQTITSGTGPPPDEVETEVSDIGEIGKQLISAKTIEDTKGAWDRIVGVIGADERTYLVREYVKTMARLFEGVEGPGPALGAIAAEVGRIADVVERVAPAELAAARAAYKVARDRKPA